jgi:hypothetical protein
VTGPRKKPETEENPDIKVETAPVSENPDKAFIEPEAPEAVAPKEQPTKEEVAGADAVELPAWYPGQPCPECGAVSGEYKWTTLAGCSACLIEGETEDEEG